MKNICISQVWPVMPKFIRNFRIVSRGALKGSMGREFDTPGITYCNRRLLSSFQTKTFPLNPVLQTDAIIV